MEGTIEGNFQTIFQRCKNNDYSSYKEEDLLRLIYEIEELLRVISQEGFFSKNEELDDVSTESLKYLFLQYYHGKCLINMQDLEHRIDNLNSGKSSLLRFIETCKQYGLLHETEVAKIDETRKKPMNADEKRMYKIEKFKREKLAKKRIQEITRFLAIVSKDETVDHEEEQRELYTLTLQSYSRDALDEIDMLEEELVMLKMRQQTLNPSNEPGNPNSSQPVPSNAPLALPENRPGLSVMKTFKVGDQLMMSRETVKATIFGPGIAPPTISLEEFADMEKEAAEARAKQQADAPKGPRKYAQLELDGDEDDLDLVDEATMEDRRWDDWKDDNPRGWGNKMGKRY